MVKIVGWGCSYKHVSCFEQSHFLEKNKKKHEAPQSTQFCYAEAMLEKAEKTTHQQLLQLVTVVQEREIMEEKRRFLESIRPLK